MNVTVHSAHDYTEDKEIWFGIGETGYNRAMAFFAEHKGEGERYEYFGGDEELKFIWKLDEEGWGKIRDEVQSEDVFGSMYVGTCMVEFACAGGGFDDEYHIPIDNFYVYGMYDPDYDYWVNGVPYKLFNDIFIEIPKKETMEEFEIAFEQNVIDLLNERPDLIVEAIKKTVVDEWC